MKCGKKKPVESPPKTRLQRRKSRENIINCIIGADDTIFGCLTTFSLFGLPPWLAILYSYLYIWRGLVDVHFVIFIKVGASHKSHVYKAIGKCKN
jgi:hypothetical protein